MEGARESVGIFSGRASGISIAHGAGVKTARGLYILSLFVLAGLSVAEAKEVTSGGEVSSLSRVDYGSVYVEEQKQSRPTEWELGLDYGYELSNPYANVNDYSLSATHALGPYFRAGTLISLYSSHDTDLVNAMNHSLRSSGESQKVQHPAYSTYLTLGLTPLSGKLNFFGNQPLAFDFNLVGGAGLTHYQEGETYGGVLLQLAPQLNVTRYLGVRLSVGEQIESPWNASDRLSRLEGGAGIVLGLP